jgi:hypothetical protein
LTQAIIVKAEPSDRLAAVRALAVPPNWSAEPNRPAVVHVAPVTVAVKPFPD